jgi:Fur family zinc uptake transcriptional regulator
MTDIVFTKLRQQIFDIFQNKHGPLTAYEALDILKSIRPNAKPPTIYRAINYLVKHGVLHRIEATNQYLACSQQGDHIKEIHQGILFTCLRCYETQEYVDDKILKFIKQFAQMNQILLTHSLAQIQGYCLNCHI